MVRWITDSAEEAEDILRQAAGDGEHAGAILAQLPDGTLTPPEGRVCASLVRGQLTFPDPSVLAQDPGARDQMWRESADLTGLAAR